MIRSKTCCCIRFGSTREPFTATIASPHNTPFSFAGPDTSSTEKLPQLSFFMPIPRLNNPGSVSYCVFLTPGSQASHLPGPNSTIKSEKAARAPGSNGMLLRQRATGRVSGCVSCLPFWESVDAVLSPPMSNVNPTSLPRTQLWELSQTKYSTPVSYRPKYVRKRG
jgi:hypothetical protein